MESKIQMCPERQEVRKVILRCSAVIVSEVEKKNMSDFFFSF